MGKMLTVDPNKRCSLQTVVSHPWMLKDEQATANSFSKLMQCSSTVVDTVTESDVHDQILDFMEGHRFDRSKIVKVCPSC